MKMEMFSEDYWDFFHKIICDVLNEEGNADNIISVEEDTDSRCVLVSLYMDVLEDEDEVINYHKSLLSSLISKMQSFRFNPFKKYEYDGYGTIMMFVKAESTIKRYEF